MFSNETTVVDEPEAPVSPYYIYLLVFYIIVCIIGFLGNVSLLGALTSSGAGRLRTPQMLSACAADLLVCSTSAPIAAMRAGHMQLWPCYITLYLEAFPVAASTLSLVSIAADRCASVGRSRDCLSTRPMLQVVLVWFVANLLGVLYMMSCISYQYLKAASAIITFWFPCVAVAWFHWSVRVKLTALSLTARAAHGELPLPIPLIQRPSNVIIVAGVGPHTRRDAVDVGDTRAKRLQPSLLGPQPKTSTLRARRRLGNLLITIAAIFALCWCPYATIVICGVFGLQAPETVAQFALLLGHSHSALNAVGYWALNRHALTAACATWRSHFRAREEAASSTNEANLGAFHPRLTRPPPAPRAPVSSVLY